MKKKYNERIGEIEYLGGSERLFGRLHPFLELQRAMRQGTCWVIVRRRAGFQSKAAWRKPKKRTKLGKSIDKYRVRSMGPIETLFLCRTEGRKEHNWNNEVLTKLVHLSTMDHSLINFHHNRISPLSSSRFYKINGNYKIVF